MYIFRDEGQSSGGGKNGSTQILNIWITTSWFGRLVKE